MADQQSNLQIILRTIKQGTGDAEAQKGLGNLKGELGDLSQGLLGVNIASVGLTAGLVMAGKGALDLAYKGGEAEASLTRLDSVLKSTGGSAGMTLGQLTDLSQGVMFLTGTEDEEVQAAEAVLLTFRNMSEDIFPRVIRGAADLSAVFGMDLQSATMMLAKALSAPDEGLMALERSTGKLDQAVKDNIKSLMDQGKTLEAQNVLMAEVEKRVGGAAAAMGNTYPGQVKKLQTALSELGEAVGKTLVPPLSNAAQALTLILTMNTQIDLALKSHADSVLKAAKSYEEYTKEILRAGMAAEGMSGPEAEARIQQYLREGTTIDDLIAHYGGLTEAQFKLGKEYQNYPDYAKRVTGAMSGQKAAADDLKKSTVDYTKDLQDALSAAKEMGDYEKDLGDAEKKLADDRKKGWWDTSQTIKDDQQAIEDVQSSHQTAMWQMKADAYQYQLTLDGLFSADDEEKLLAYEYSMGLLTIAEFTAAEKARDLKAWLDGLPSSVPIDVILRISEAGGGITTPEQTLADQAAAKASRDAIARAAAMAGGYQGAGKQTGLDFTVPPDFEGDNYPLNLRVKSGERVKVETPEQQHAQGGAGGGGNGPLVGTVNNYSMWDREAASAWIRSMT
jgi:hypothetical protein